MDCNSLNSLGHPLTTCTLLVAFSAFLTSCALPPPGSPQSPLQNQYVIDRALLPDELRAKLQDKYPRYLVETASIEVVRERAPSYSIELVSATGKTLTHKEVMEGRARPRVTFEDRNRDGVIDLETRRHTTPGTRDWSAFDDDYDGFYDRQRWHGYHSWDVPVHIPVSLRVLPASPATDPSTLQE